MIRSTTTAIAARTPLIACVITPFLMLAAARPQASDLDRVVPPPMPTNIQAPEGNRAFLIAHAVGTQNYICLPSTTSGTGFAWTLFGPQATLFNDDFKQVITHFLSPNPVENGTGRATWQHSRDTSAVWGLMDKSSSDPAFVAAGAIPWLLLRAVGTQQGPTGGDKLAGATYIQRLNTDGGLPPSPVCSEVGTRMLVPYAADYVFYERARGHGRDRD